MNEIATIDNIFGILYGFFNKLIEISESIWNFLTNDVSIMGETFKPIYITGVILIAFLTAKLIKDFVPVA